MIMEALELLSFESPSHPSKACSAKSPICDSTENLAMAPASNQPSPTGLPLSDTIRRKCCSFQFALIEIGRETVKGSSGELPSILSDQDTNAILVAFEGLTIG